MSDVFISYAREDRIYAERVAATLTRQGYDVFWDNEIPPGQTWADFTESKLTASKAALVLWSAASRASQWVREEARIARDHGKLIPVLIDSAPVPFGFGEMQAADLARWDGSVDHPDWARVVSAVAARVGRAPVAIAATPAWSMPHLSMPNWSAQTAPLLQKFATQAADAGAHASAAISPAVILGYIRKCSRLYFDGRGRARRLEYWSFALFQFVLISGCLLVDSENEAPVLTAVFALALAGPGFSVMSRRLHDVGLSGWCALAALLPAFGWGFLLAVAVLPGQKRDNSYGPDPRTTHAI